MISDILLCKAIGNQCNHWSNATMPVSCEMWVAYVILNMLGINLLHENCMLQTMALPFPCSGSHQAVQAISHDCISSFLTVLQAYLHPGYATDCTPIQIVCWFPNLHPPLRPFWCFILFCTIPILTHSGLYTDYLYNHLDHYPHYHLPGYYQEYILLQGSPQTSSGCTTDCHVVLHTIDMLDCPSYPSHIVFHGWKPTVWSPAFSGILTMSLLLTSHETLHIFRHVYQACIHISQWACW